MDHLTQPDVSILLAVRDGAGLIAGALDSILAQDDVAWELILVDDGSRDATAAVVEGFLEAEPELHARTTFIRQSPAGLAASLNRAACHARAPILARLDADDRMLSDRLAHQVRCLQAGPEIVLGGGWLDEQGITHTPYAREPWEVAESLRTRNPIVHPTVAMKAAHFWAVGGYDPTVEVAQDLDLWRRMTRRGYQLRNLPDTLIRRCEGPWQVSRRRPWARRWTQWRSARRAES